MKKRIFGLILAFGLMAEALAGCAGYALEAEQYTAEKGKETAGASEELSGVTLSTEWDLTDLYADEDAFNADMDYLLEHADYVEKYRGTLNNADAILEYIEDEELLKQQAIFNKAMMYTSFLSSLNASDPWAQQAGARYSEALTQSSTAQGFVKPEIMELPLKERQEIFSDERFAPYAYAFREFTDPEAVVLSEEANRVETLLNAAADQAQSAYSVFDNVENKRPEITYPDGSTGTLTDQAYSQILSSTEYDHDFRKSAYDARNSFRRAYENTYAELLAGEMKRNWAEAQIYGFDTTLDYISHRDALEPELFYNMIDFAHSLLPEIHKYYAAEKEALGLSEMGPYDLNIPVTLVDAPEMSYEDCARLGREAVKFWGEEYLETFDRILLSSHIDVYPSETKESGAYEDLNGNETTPYVLFNFDGLKTYTGVIVHELGHAVYSELAAENQNVYNNETTVFTQEVASTANELAFYRKMVEEAENEEEKAYWLGKEINRFLDTIFTQCRYAEFEDYCYKTLESGGALSASGMDEKYAELMRTYYGDAITVEDSAGVDWARVPHFYYGYYVYQYATSLTYATAINNKALEDEGEKEKYLDFLKAGGSDYPAELLKIADVDPMDPATYEEAGDYIIKLIDEYISLISPEEQETEEAAKENALPMDPSVMKPWINSTVYGMVTGDYKPDLKDDLYLYVNHDWAEQVRFRPGYSSDMQLFDAMDIVKERCMELLSDKELLNSKDPQVVHDASLIQGLYELYLDWDSRNELGVTPFEPMVEEILSIGSIKELTEFLLSEDNYYWGTFPASVNLGKDAADSSLYNVEIGSTALYTYGDAAEYEEETPNGKRSREYVDALFYRDDL